MRSFFEDPDRGREEWEEPDWGLPPRDVFPGVAPVGLVLARSDTAAVGLTGIRAWPQGFAFTMLAVLRPGAVRRGRWPRSPMPFWAPMDPFEPNGGDDEQPPPRLLRIGVQYPDGRKVTNTDIAPPWAGRPFHGRSDELEMMPLDGEGDERAWRQDSFVSPLPGPGLLRFGVVWPDQGIDETVVEVDAQPIIDAASRAVPLWPDTT